MGWVTLALRGAGGSGGRMSDDQIAATMAAWRSASAWNDDAVTPRSAFVNRVGELSALTEEVARAASGESRVVHICGPAGIGKTALVGTFLNGHPEPAGIRVAGSEHETGVHLGVAETLLRTIAVRGGWPAGPASSAASLHPLACGMALLHQLGLAQRGNGVVTLIVDNLEWVDPASLVALAFALRRLSADRILVILIGREETPPDTALGQLIAGPHGQCMPVTGLDTAAVRELAARLGSRVLSVAQADIMRAHTDGNPLYLRSLLAELPPGGTIDAHWLPAPEAFATVALAPLARSPEPARRLVAAAAVLGMEARLTDAARLALVPSPAEAASAVPGNLLELVNGPLGWVLRFTHPLNRAAVYHDLPLSERARLHALAAGNTVGRVALRHRVHATFHPDPALAADLMTAAAGETAHGQLQTAAEDLVAAARVHPDAQARHRLILDAANLRLWASDPSGAAALLATALDASGSRWHYVHGHLAAVTGRLGEARSELEAAWAHIGPADDDLRGPMACLLAQLAILHSRGSAGAGWAARAVDALPPGHPLLSLSSACLAVARWLGGEGTEAMAGLAALPANPAAVTLDDAAQLAVRGQLCMWGDDLAGSRADSARALQLSREIGVPLYALTAAGYLTEAEYRLGEWGDAVVHGDLAVSLAEDCGQLWFGAFTHGIAALVWAARGGWQVAEAHVAAAAAVAHQLGNEASLGYAANAAAHLAFARQDWPDVVAAGTPLYGLGNRSGIFEPGVLRWRELYQEGLIAVGQLNEARRDVAESLELACDRGRRSALARLSRPRAALALADGNPDRARSALEEGIEHAEAVCGPFDQALLLDALGRLLRRQGERRQAASRLQAAIDRYGRLRAVPFLSRCGDELAACGLHPAPRVPGPMRLSPREQAVVRLAVRGLTNRQIAAELVISVKTVECHLANVFAKLGVSTRTQLAAKVAAARAGHGPVQAAGSPPE
jgi:DNA-binding NarL/FixJ family response regulator